MSTSLRVEQPAELLAFLFASCPEVKKTKVRQWLKHGAVRVNGQPVTRYNHPLQPGDAVSIHGKSETRTAGLLPPGLKIVFEDETLIVIDKPADLLSMASDTEREKTAYAYLTHYVRGGNPRNRRRIWIVHRLDRETSGLMVFAKTEAAKQSLQADWAKAEKRYLAVVEGDLPADHGVLKSHLDESRSFKVHSAAPSEETRLAVTHYRVVRQMATLSLLEVTTETGRRHQIRVQLADIKCPIVGDLKYGARTNPAGRLGLHACALQFNHPVTGERMRFESPLPQDLALARLV